MSVDRKRFLRALAQQSEDLPKPVGSCNPVVGSHLKTDSGPVEGEASTESNHGAVRFTFDALYQFQGMQGFAEQKPMPQNMENFRKRPNYDGSRRKFFSKQYDRQSHADNGPSKARVDRLLSLDACRCQRRNCFAKFRLMIEELMNFLHLFWSLARASQDAFVLFVASRKKGVHRRPWFLLEKQVSPACLMALLGMGNDRLKRILECRLDMRRSFGIVRKRTARKRKIINLYLLRVYLKAAGMLPNKFQRGARTRGGKEKITAIFGEPASESDASNSDREEDNGDDATALTLGADGLEADEELKLHVLGLSSYFTACVETNFGNNLKKLPTRWLPPGNLCMLYYQMQVDDKNGISYAHFWRVFRQQWQNLLKFLPSSTNGACDICTGYKTAFKKAHLPQTKYDNAKGYKAHIDEVSRDRDLEDYMQSQSPLTKPGSPLCIHWDGMDQSKWRIPRYHGPNGQRPLKSTMNLQRPQLKVQGVWIHGVVLDLWVLDPRCAADSTMVIETAARSIEFALDRCRELGVVCPDQLLVWADNCVRENKNGQLLRFFGWLCATGRMRMCGYFFSRVGHTHSHCDQIYGLISTAMKYLDILADGTDVAQKIEHILHRIGVRQWIGEKAKIRVQYINGIRDWKKWLQAAPITFSGGLKTDESGLHAFIFMRRTDVPTNLKIVAHGRGAGLESHDNDVVLMVKRNAADDGLAQEPMMAFPYRYVALLEEIPSEPRELKAIKPAKRII